MELLDDAQHKIKRNQDILLATFAITLFFSQVLSKITIGGLYSIAATGGLMNYLQLLITTALALLPVIISFFLQHQLFRRLTLILGLANLGLLGFTYYKLINAGVFAG